MHLTVSPCEAILYRQHVSSRHVQPQHQPKRSQTGIFIQSSAPQQCETLVITNSQVNYESANKISNLQFYSMQ
jgi:hypothetical protein